jgi:hypothetical protein
MAPKIIQNVDSTSTEVIKAKRGRKSKKELMAALNIEPLFNDTSKTPKQFNTSNSYETISLNVCEIIETEGNELDYNESSNIASELLTHDITDEQKPIVKKRGRKPKGGKIIQQISSIEPEKEEKPNIILHLKCSMKDLQNSNKLDNMVDSYTFGGSNKNDLSYELIGSEHINNVNNYYNDTATISNTKFTTEFEEDEEIYCKESNSNKDIWKKLKQLEHNLHINNVNNKRSSCFWDTCEFDNPPIYIPKHFINDTYHVYGCFCSPECGVAYLMNENIDSSSKFERYHLFNHIYSKIYNYEKNIKPAPNPYYMLEKYYGNLSIQEYRSLLRNERLFLIVDKPLTRILPELHEDNDDFILNNKLIPSNNYQIKTKLQRKKQNKSSILNEKFGITNQQQICE